MPFPARVMPFPFADSLRRHITTNLAAFERRELPLESRRAAAVAVALLPDPVPERPEGRACFVLTVRTDLGRHSGQFALPGGRRDPGETVEEAALRELEEEVGLAVPPSAVLGLLDDYPSRSGFVITPVVVWGEASGALEPDPSEVAAVFRVGLDELDRTEHPILSSIPESDRPVLSLAIRGHRVYAPTAAILYQFLEVALRGRPTRVADYEDPVFAWR